MISNVSIIQRKEARGRIIALLYEQYGRWTQVSSLINALMRDVVNPDTEIPNQLHYLADDKKAYITVMSGDDAHAGIAPMRDSYVQLTAAGCDLVEGDCDDPGILYGDGRRA